MNTSEQTYPAVYSQTPAPKVSAKYQFIPTTDIIALMKENGFYAREMRQMGTRSKDPQYVKHSIRFRHQTQVELYGAIPEILITTSHDTSAGFQARGGLYRPVCLNGLVIGQDVYRL